MITETQLEKMLYAFRKQLEYEDKCSEAYQVIFPDSYPPFHENYLSNVLCEAIDMLLGLEDWDDFTSWWVYETNMGQDHPDIIWDGIPYHLANAHDIITLAKMVNAKKEK